MSRLRLLVGPSVSIRPATVNDMDLISLLRNAEGVRCWFLDDRPVDREQGRQWLDRQNRQSDSGLLLVCATIDASFLGFLGWSAFDRSTGTIELGRLAIDRWRHVALARKLGHSPPVAEEASRLLLEYAFTTLGAVVARIEIIDGNRNSLALSRRLGFSPIAWSERVRPEGRPVRVQVLQLSRVDWAHHKGPLRR